MWDRRPTPRRGGDRDAEMRSEREGEGERKREIKRERYEVDEEMHLDEVAAASSRRRGRSVRHCRSRRRGRRSARRYQISLLARSTCHR
jgi:hypothetical protein